MNAWEHGNPASGSHRMLPPPHRAAPASARAPCSWRSCLLAVTPAAADLAQAAGNLARLLDPVLPEAPGVYW